MKANPPASWPNHRGQETPTNDYRVIVWEQPYVEGEPEIGWGERTFDLTGVEDVHEVIEWAERQLTLDEGPYSARGDQIRDREYVLYAKVPGEDRFLQIAGWDPSLNPLSDNLR